MLAAETIADYYTESSCAEPISKLFPSNQVQILWMPSYLRRKVALPHISMCSKYQLIQVAPSHLTTHFSLRTILQTYYPSHPAFQLPPAQSSSSGL